MRTKPIPTKETVESIPLTAWAKIRDWLLKCAERREAARMPNYETTWIGDGCVFLVIEKGKIRRHQSDFLTGWGFELVEGENGFLLYSSRLGDNDDAQRMWQAAWAFLRSS